MSKKRISLYKSPDVELTLVVDGKKKSLRFWQEGYGERRITAFAADGKVRRNLKISLKELIRRKLK